MNKYSDLSSRIKSPENTKLLSKAAYYKSNGFNSRFNSINSFKDLLGAKSETELYNNRLDFRVASPGISSISQAQNEILKNFSSKIFSPNQSKLKLPEISGRFTTEKNFTDIIEKLDEIITPKLHFTETILSDSESSQFILEAEGYQCFKIFTKGKKCPLCIKIHRSYGKVISFFSLTDNKPGINGKNKPYTKGYIEINDLSHEFKSEFVYLGIKALAETSFRIILTFGKIKNLDLYSKYTRIINETPDILTFNDDMYSDDDNYDRSKSKISKNFIKINMDIKLLNSSKDIQVKAEKWKNKREEVMFRRKKNLKEKKIKTFNLLTKRIQRLEEESLKRDRAEKHQELQIIHRN